MTIAYRSTLVVHGRLAMRESRLAAGRDGRHGLQIMSFEQAAVRLAGGFARPIDDESLRAAIQAALPATPMGELESIKALPGMIDAAADTLHKAWRAGIDLAAHAADHPRLAAIARLEAAVLDQLPPGMMRPLDIAAAATARIGHTPTVLGPMEIVGLTELSPCWRPLLQALTAHIPVQWTAGPRSVPAWLSGTGVTVTRAPAQEPGISAVSAATAYHEAIEAMRWARHLLASGVSASEIAIATASPADYDDHFLALRADANIDLHFVHGVRTVTTREGQAAAALADIVVRGLSQSRLRRLAALCRDSGPFETLPEGWLILHKLMEEVLTGETPEAEAALTERAADLIRALGRSSVADPATGLSAQELAACVAQTLALPDIAALRPGLLAEFPVYAAQVADGVKTATAGIADALTLTTEGRPAVVVDWKSDVTPAPGTLDHYRAQVRAYLDMTSAERGLIVLMTSGSVIPVLPTKPTESEAA